MTLQLTFHRIADKLPNHGAHIFYIREGYSSTGLVQGEAYYIWRQLDEQGQFTSIHIEYNPDEPQPSDTQLIIACNQEELFPYTLWADVDGLLTQYDQDNQNYQCPHSYQELPGYCRFCGQKEPNQNP